MPPHSQLPGNLTRGKLCNALQRVGFIIDDKGGDGSHCKATWPDTQKSITIQKKIPKQVLSYLIKEIEEVTPITWEHIKKEL